MINGNRMNEAKTEEKKLVRTAAYCRVSTELELQEGSFDIQMKYYTDLIKQNPEWEFVGVYGDKGRSGLNTENRPGLQSLLKDCRDGKIDLILCKSVSRFARNMGDFVEMVRELRKMGINMYFEKEKADTKDPQMDWILDTLAIIAEEESNSISQHLIQSYNQKSKDGRPSRVTVYGYYKGSNNTWVVNGTQAKRVKKAFEMAYEGRTYTEIKDALNAMEEEPIWKQDRIKSMLKNVAYKGDIYTHSTVKLTPNSRAVKNNGYRKRYYIKDHHEALVPAEMFDKVQEIMNRGLLLTRGKRSEADIEFLRGLQNGNC